MAGKEITAFGIARKQNEQTTAVSIKDKVIDFIKACLSPEKIFLVHHEIKENKQELFDLMVVIPETVQINFNYYEQVISMANIEHANLHVSLHKSANLYKQLEEGHVYYSIVCNTTNLIYDNGLTDLPIVNEDMLQPVIQKANNAFNIAHKKADSFLQGASNYYGENDVAMTAFMLQQAVELTIRGLITALLGSCTKTHCISALKKPLKRCVPELQYLLSNNEAEESRLLHLLEKAYLEGRYSNEFAISDNNLSLLIRSAEELHEKVKVLFNKKMYQLIPNHEGSMGRYEGECKEVLS